MKRGRVYLYPISDNGWSPFTIGSFEDLHEAGIVPKEGLHLKFYVDDADEGGNPDDLFFEGIVHFEGGRGWGAIVESESFHSESDEKEGFARTKVDLGGQRK
jgi:hypothetical protein